MLEILILISYLNLSNFPDNIYYKEELTQYSSISDDFIIVNYRYNGHFLYLETGKNLKDWGDESFNNNFRILLAGKLKKSVLSSGRRAEEGLIPDIDLDLKMPRGLSYILGEGGEIKVEGYEEIDVEVKQSRQTYGERGSYSSFPQIILDQRTNAKVNGTVGEKLHIAIDHDSDKAEKDNTMKIWYGGSVGGGSEVEDDIVQELHLGTIEGGGSEKLFGITTRGKVGSTSFDLSAGKLDSDDERGVVPLNISSSTTTKNERDYLKEEYFYTGLPHSSDSLIEYGLFVYDDNGIHSDLVLFNGDIIEGGNTFLELTEDADYELGVFRFKDIPGKPSLPYFRILNTSVINGRSLGVYLIFADSAGKEDTLGKIKRDAGGRIDSLTLYQLKSTYPSTADPSWNYQMRNIYSLGVRNPSGIEVEIYKVVQGGNDLLTDNEGRRYSELLGITDKDGNLKPSRILMDEGCLVFPDQFPFLNPELGVDTVSVIYRKKDPDEDKGKNFAIVITTTSSVSGNFRLKSGGPIINDSEVLTVGGRTLVRGEDYTINYVTGEVELLKREELPLDAEVDYVFKSTPFFTFSSKYQARLNVKATPIEGSRLDFDFGFLSRSDKGVFHPRVGKEPSNIKVGKIDFSLKKEPEFLSRTFASLPFVDDDSKSRFNIDGTYGFSMPNPATNGKSYLDDMESVAEAVDVDLSSKFWHYSSQPDGSLNINDLAKLDWFTNSFYSYSRIFSEYSSVSYSENRTSVMVLYFRPNDRNNWGGIMRTFGREQNLSRKNFLEVWIKAEEEGGMIEEGEMIFEMGNRMNEDQIRWRRVSSSTDSIIPIPPNGKRDSEDKNFDGHMQTGEDTGLDGIKWDDDTWAYNADSLDDGVDDCVLIPESLADSLKIHNKEGNKVLDSEDLNKDGVHDMDNSCFRYTIDLSSPEYLAKEGLNGWKIFIIPLKDTLSFEKIGDPSFEDILYTRMWFRGMDEDTRITIAKLAIVGNSWRDKGILSALDGSLNPSGGSFKVSYRNTLEDEDYIPPVERERRVASNLFEKEQSLVLEMDSLLTNNYCLVENYLELPIRSMGKGYDFRLYKALNFYARYQGDTSDSVQVFLRLLTDSVNYYQFKTYTYRDNWDTLKVVFENFTDLKISGDSIQEKYSLKGNPSLQSIAFLQLGVINKEIETLKGEVLIDDIILKEADNRMGSDIDLSISTNVGDLITGLSYNINRKSSNYKNRLDDLRELGDREASSQGFRVTANAGKFLNKFINCPITLNMKESHRIPVYRVNSDVTLLPEEADSLTDNEYTRDLIFSLSRPSGSDNWFLKHTIDNLKLSGSLRETKSLKPLKSADTVRSTTGSVSYRLQLPKLSLPVFSGEGSSLLPTRIELKTSYEYKESKKYNYKDSLYEKIEIPIKKEITGYAGVTYEPVRWINLDYSISARNDLRERESFSEKFSLRDLGQDASLREEISATHRSKQFEINNLNVTYRTTFNQNHGIEYSRSLVDSLGIPLDVRAVSQQRTIRINDNLELRRLLEKIPLISKFSKNISPIKMSANFAKNGTFAYLNSKPDYKFRYGIETIPESALFVRPEKNDGGYLNEVYSISSGFSSSKMNVKMDIRYSCRKPDEKLIENTQQPKETRKYTFPDIDVDFPNIQKYVPFLGKVVRRASVSVSMSRDSSWTIGLGDKPFSEGGSSFNISPALKMDFKNGLGVTITPQYSKSQTYPDSKLNTYGRTKGVRINCKYTIKPSASGFPLLFFGRVKLDKPLNLNASFTYRDNEKYWINASGVEAALDDSRTIEFNLNGRYTFSEMVSGGLTINFRNYLNKRLENMSSTTYGGSFNVRLRF